MPHRKSIRFATSPNSRKNGDNVSSRRTNNHKPAVDNHKPAADNHKPPADNHKLRDGTDRLKETITAILGAVFLWLFVFQAVYRVILHFAEAYLFLLRSCRLMLLRLFADCRLLLGSVRQIFLGVRIQVLRFCSCCLHLPVDLVRACKNVRLHADIRALDVLMACSSPFRQGILVCVLMLDWYCRTARRGGCFLLHCTDTVFNITSLVSQVLWRFILAGVHTLKAAQNILIYTVMSYVCMAQLGLRLLMDCVNAILVVGRLLDRLARWLWQDVERGVESVILEFLATTWQILRTSAILGVYSVIICVRLVQVIGSWSLALCWGVPWSFQPAPITKKPYSVQSKPFQTSWTWY